MEVTKTCTKCHADKTIGSFYKNKLCKGGLDPHCKECKKAVNKAARLRRKLLILKETEDV